MLPGGRGAGRRRASRSSVDTMRAEVAAAARRRGRRARQRRVRRARRPGDAARRSPGSGVPYVAMHWRGHSDRMADLAHYDDVVADVRARARRAARRARSPPGVDADAGRARPGPRLRQERRPQLGAARAPRRARRRSGVRCWSASRASASSASCCATADGRRPRPRSATSRRPCCPAVRAGRRLGGARPRRARRARGRRGRARRDAGGRPDEPTRSRCAASAHAASTACCPRSAATARTSSSTSRWPSTPGPPRQSDDLARTVDYSAVAAAVVAVDRG